MSTHSLLAVSVPASYKISSEELTLKRRSEKSFSLKINFGWERNNWYELTAETRPLAELLLTLDDAGRASRSRLPPEETAGSVVYRDAGGESSVVIRRSERTGLYSVSGLLAGLTVIQPLTYWSQTAGCADCLPTYWHNLTRLDLNTGAGDYSLNVSLARQGRQQQYRVSKVYPEILVMVDFSLYERLSYSLADTQNYVISYFNTVNSRFSGLSQPGVELMLVGVVVATSPSSLPYLTTGYDGAVLDAALALDAMGRYYFPSRPDLPGHDLVVALTAKDLASFNSRGYNPSTAGYAYVGGACARNSWLGKVSSVAVVEDSGGYSGVLVAAHEIAHLLGVVHDGDRAPPYLAGPGASSCSWYDGYIMSDYRRDSRSQTWSACSVRQLRHFLTTSHGSCLTNYPRRVWALPGPGDLPGQRTSLDLQCWRDQGTRACFHDQRVCSRLYCYDKTYRRCLSYRPAVEGSDCGPNKQCRAGVCRARATSKPVSLCQDSSRRQGSLTCNQIFSRYSATYCVTNRSIQAACCRSYRAFCFPRGRSTVQT